MPHRKGASTPPSWRSRGLRQPLAPRPSRALLGALLGALRGALLRSRRNNNARQRAIGSTDQYHSSGTGILSGRGGRVWGQHVVGTALSLEPSLLLALERNHLGLRLMLPAGREAFFGHHIPSPPLPSRSARGLHIDPLLSSLEGSNAVVIGGTVPSSGDSLVGRITAYGRIVFVVHCHSSMDGAPHFSISTSGGLGGSVTLLCWARPYGQHQSTHSPG